MAQSPLEGTEPRVQQLVIGPGRETGLGPQGTTGVGLCVFLISNLIFMKKFLYSVAVLFFFSLLIVPQATNAQEAPVIIRLSQPSVAIDSPVTLMIEGSGFGNSQGEVINMGTGVKLNIGHWYDTEIKVYYPHLVAPNALNVGDNSIKVRTSSGIESALTNIIGTKYGSAIITSVAPNDIYMDDEVVINGSGFGIDGVNGKTGFLSGYGTTLLYTQSVLSWSDTQIRIKINSPPTGFTGNTNLVVGGRLPDTRLYFSDFVPVTVSYSPRCSADTWDCSGWGVCSSLGTQTRSCNKTFECPSVDTSSPATTQTCSYIPACTSSSWSCGSWSSCSSSGSQTRSCNKIINCEGGVSSPTTSQSCTPSPTPKGGYICYPACDASTCVNGKCGAYGYMNATAEDKISLVHRDLNLAQKITVGKTQIDSWNLKGDTLLEFLLPDNISTGPQFVNVYHLDGNLIATGTLTIYSKATLPTPPSCTADTWVCGNWGACLPSSIQSRTCNKTFDCSSVETAPPTTSQFCQSSTTPSSPSIDPGIHNQDVIIKSTVKLLCPMDSTRASQGSGTVIDSLGTILTNKHVVSGTLGCLVGFVNSSSDEPYFGARQIADIKSISSSQDIATLKIRNPNNVSLTSVGIATSSSNNLRLGDKLHIYGYPAKFGTKMTFTSGDYSGVDGGYLKTTAILEYGNSGGGAYTSNGKFIGIPSAVVKGELNSLGYILSINTVNSWLNNSPLAYIPNTNNYSRVSLLDDINLADLDKFGLYIPGVDATNENVTMPPSVISSFTKRLLGQILLQVESVGEAWYVNPVDGKKYYMKDGPTAYQMMRQFGLGITNANLAKIPQEGETKTFPTTLNHVKGKILLQVEDHGEAWYVHPKTGIRYYMKDGEAAYNLMRYYSLGITNADLEKIPVGDL
ncbi:MAG: hypothetical protein A3I29_02020 [Candidatus Magasanikbacteria bacterium RIFCSPLOWO2_02_FULL_44_11]|uniref:IPT/TIG domain-containing protein n=1 Tax=Candidatus Magasanikbacteria bacterium RIFCSPLOWO2_02_FULL_44_11 TaxID=1798689 RepID=A0A1F6NAQ7_9BACT|nr:MAG: hypothetical protein A3I29_02020 [Candidatus Magasanikbacteria bacterium RIFCSPLOWO2_02_FULL_44_11]